MSFPQGLYNNYDLIVFDVEKMLNKFFVKGNFFNKFPILFIFSMH